MSEEQPVIDFAARHAAQEEEKRLQGRYTLEEAAQILEQDAGERAEGILKKLKKAVSNGELPVYEPSEKAQYHPETVRVFSEEVYWDDLNRWFAGNEPRIDWRFPMPESVRNESEFVAAFGETVYNGTIIDWKYWVHQMPVLTTAQAARLICGLDPDIFQNLDNRPNNNDPSLACNKARKIQRLAETQGIEKVTPKEWLQWADKHTLKVHVGFRLEVEALESASNQESNTHARFTGVNTCDLVVDGSLTKREKQIRAIEEIADELGYTRLKIPTRGKQKIQTECKTRYKDRFGVGDDPFMDAWKEAVRNNRIRMAEHDKFSRR